MPRDFPVALASPDLFALRYNVGLDVTVFQCCKKEPGAGDDSESRKDWLLRSETIVAIRNSLSLRTQSTRDYARAQNDLDCPKKRRPVASTGPAIPRQGSIDTGLLSHVTITEI